MARILRRRGVADRCGPVMRGEPGRRADYAAFRRIPTRWMDGDVYGHVNNVVHYALFDTAVNGWLIEQGLLDPRTSERIGLVVETGCRYHGEIVFPDVVAAGLRVARLGTSSVRYEVGRPAPLAPPLRAALGMLRR